MLKSKRIIVACTNASGEADMFACDVNVNDDQYDLGIHYDLAKDMASEAGYTEPFLCFDEHEQKNIVRQISELSLPIPFTIHDEYTNEENTLSGTVQITDLGIGINLIGYSDCCSKDDKGNVAYLEYWKGKAKLLAYSDINREEPTIINLEQAKNGNRTESIYFNLLQTKLSLFDNRIELNSEFSDKALEDGLNIMQAVESYFSDFTFDLTSLTPLKGQSKLYSEQVKELDRPYAKITEAQKTELTKGKSDFYKTNGGLVVTFGAADGGFALMPLNQEAANKILSTQ